MGVEVENKDQGEAGKGHGAVPSSESKATSELSAAPALTVRFFPYQPKLCSGNVVWAERDRGSDYYRVSKFQMKRGVFPPDHPVGGTKSEKDRSQLGSGDKIEAFRARGYWASCFPEGDGITFQHEDERADETVINDIRECFGWNVVRG